MNPPARLPETKARILLVDDHPLIITALNQVINASGDLMICGVASTATTTVNAVVSHQPHLVVLDLRLKEGDALELIKSLMEQFPLLHILVLSQYDESVYAERVLRAGAHGYLMKDQAIDELLTAIRTILTGEVYLSRTMANQLLRKNFLNQPAPKTTRLDNLTDRELQVLMLIGNGRSTRKIAEELHLSIKTVETYREHLKHKLHLAGSTELVHFATQWVNRNCQPS
jgi:DNA-binding NarL/FixJ family response regulator